MGVDGYLLDSGGPYRLWCRFWPGIGVKKMIQGYGCDLNGLLGEAEEEFAAAL